MRVKIIFDKFFEEITFLGGILFFLLFSILFLILGKPDMFFQLILGLIIIYVLTFLIRLFYFKARPKKVHYKNFLEKLDASSFPSVHAARITFISLFLIISFFPKSIFILIIVILWFLTLYSRIYLKKHFYTDLIGGVILGILSLISLFFRLF